MKFKKNIIKILFLLNTVKNVFDIKLYGSSSKFLFFFYSCMEIVAIFFINIVRKIIIESIDLQHYTNLEFSVEFKYNLMYFIVI